MSLSVYSKTAIFSKNVGSLASPNRDALVGEWFFGVDQQSTIANRAGSLPLTPVGNAPAYNEGFVKFGPTGGANGNNAFTVPTVPKLDGGMTIVVVARNNAASGLSTIIKTTSGSTSNVGIYDSAGKLAYYSGGTALADMAQVPAPVANKWSVVAAVGGRGDYGQIHLWQSGIKTSGIAPAVGARATAIYPPYTMFNAVATNIDIAYLAIYERNVPEDELLKIYDGLKQMMLLRGVTL